MTSDIYGVVKLGLGQSQTAALTLNSLSNPDLRWEGSTTLNFGLDFSVFKGRVGLTVDAFQKDTKDLLLQQNLSYISGWESQWQNIGKIRNKGLEISLKTINVDKKNFSWSTTFTISHNRQMVDDIGNENYVATLSSWGSNSFMMYGYKKGYPLNSLWGFQYAGPWQNIEQLERNQYTQSYVSSALASESGLSSLLGHPKYVDQNKDGVLSEKDLIYLGNSDPVLYGGLNNTFHWKNLKFSFYFIYSLGGKIYNYSETFMGGGYSTNQYRYMLDCWHPVRNPDSMHPKAGIGYNLMPSSRQVHDASYLRLKTVSIGYTLPFKKGKTFKDMTFTLTGDNLALWTEYNGFDPDVSTSKDNSTLRRVDMGAYPKSRMVVFSVQLRY
jgi:hypothetical protein